MDGLPDAERTRVPPGTIGAFVSDTVKRAYPLTERVADFLEQDSLEFRRLEPRAFPDGTTTTSADDVKRSVKDWYDRFGWRKNERGLYMDSALFSQNKPVGHGLYEMMSHLSVLDRLPGGEFVLDAASGAMAHPEHLAYSWFYKSRICVDMSMTALMEADAKLRPSDFCFMADICNLPFRDETFDGAVSGYTIQHIPESQQLSAVEELYRVLSPGAHLCIFTDIPYSRRHKVLLFTLRAFRKLLKTLRLVRRPSSPSDPRKNAEADPPHQLYFHSQKPSWWKEAARGLTDRYSIESLRLLNKFEFEWLYGRSNRAAKTLRWVESVFPRLTCGMSAYCLVDIYKPVQGDQ